MIRERIVKFCRLQLGMKPVIDYAQSRRRLLGIGDLPIRTVFDIGANVGKKARQYRKLFPDATLYCFEPVPATHQQLQRWASRQRGVYTFNIALGSRSGATHMHCNQKHSGGSTLLPPEAHRKDEFVLAPVQVETLDRMARHLDVQDQIFVKIDVEGFDLEVIRGGMNLLSRAAAVMIEIALPDVPTDLPTFGQFMQVMTSLGYLYRGNLTHGYVNGTARLADAVFIRPQVARLVA